MSAFVKKLEEMLAPSIEAMGFSIVILRLMDGGKRKTLQILAERKDGSGITLDECANISRTVSTILDVEDVFDGAYDLEVSSPGLNRPLVKREDYERFVGRGVRVETFAPIDGRRRFSGLLLGIEGDDVRVSLSSQPEPVRIPFSGISSARLEVTEEEFKLRLKKQKEEGVTG